MYYTLLLVFLILSPLHAAYDPSLHLKKITRHHHQYNYTYEKVNRTVKLTVYSNNLNKTPVILLSHGLGGTRDSMNYLASHWASRGFTVIAMQHAGSDKDVIKNAPRLRKLSHARKV